MPIFQQSQHLNASLTAPLRGFQSMSFVFSIITHQYKILTAPERQHTS